ncbi:WecB/TagA/CpsF family glycosyltransferase [Pseudomonas sp. HR96]|uniref:WecB/TagA/CpsF family glycosyltransferase n=1 Tax=Pseudomonas sp. HR96 TaxID=1027966 RepID=UPI002A74F5C8|nr:WecB/TagA/CpsF family glycosyltransferase [Pseudomonas sp. HR96]WPO99088.1 WecB/TagA/CpsF family glycosyltransferase [Pseudomonas sp. HR96]
MKVFGIDLYTGTLPEFVKELEVLSRGPYGYVVTANVNHVVMLEHDRHQGLIAAYQNATFRICDSRILLPWMNKLGANISEVIPGSTLTVAMLDVAQQQAWPITVIGCEDEVMDSLRAKYPAIRFNHYNPPMGFIKQPAEVEKTVDYVIAHPARLIIYSVGAPRQEELALKVMERGGAVGMGLCAGASLNFVSGKVKRAPEWVQKLSLEWAHRILSEPQRLAKRYVVDLVRIIPIVSREMSARRAGGQDSKQS